MSVSSEDKLRKLLVNGRMIIGTKHLRGTITIFMLLVHIYIILTNEEML